MSRFRLATLLLASMLAGAIGPSLQRTAYQSWSIANERLFGAARFAQRVDLALANPGALGNGGGAVQGAATSLSAVTDPGGGLCLDGATGTLLGLCNAVNEILTIGGSANLQFSSTAAAVQTWCQVAAGCESDFGATTAPGMIFKEMGGSNMSAAAVNFQWQGSNTPSTILMQLQGGGNLALPRTNAAQAQVLLAGAPGDANMVGGAFQVGTGGMYEDGHFCSVSMSNASPSLSSSPATDFNCFVTAAAGSAIAVNYQITFPTEASTRTNAPSCYINYQAGAAQTSVPTCTVSTANPMVATVIFGVAPTTTGRFNILLMANGP